MSGFAGAAAGILMIGHSLFGDLGPELLQGALGARHPQVQVQAQIINGAPLRYSWEHGSQADGVNARRVLPRGKVSHLILTEALPLANHIEWSDTDKYAMAYAGLALKANPAAQIYVQETWHSLNSGTGAHVPDDAGAGVPWRKRIGQDLPVWEGIVAKMRQAAPQAADRIHLIPAGQGMGRLSDEIRRGKIPGLRSIADVFDDDIHPNVLGHYFLSMIQYAVLTGENPKGLPHDLKDKWGNALPGPDAALAAALQRVAWTTARKYRSARKAALTPRKAAQGRKLTVSDPPLAELVQATYQDPAGPVEMAIGLAEVSDWSAQQPFLDVMKTARPFFGHLAGQWGGYENETLQAAGYLDNDGWPNAKPHEVGSIATLILTDMPEGARDLAGRYVLRFDGAGVVEAKGRVDNLRYGKNELRFDYEPGPGSVEIRIQRSAASDPVRQITLVREDRLELFDKGVIFNPDWLDRIAPFEALRFMDWMATNDSEQSAWTDRPRVDDASWGHKGVPLEIMVALANGLGIDPWFNIPHLADDDYVTNFAQLVAETLDPSLTAYVEYSNEVWNWQFEQTVWADAQATALWGQEHKGMQFFGMRAAEVAKIWTGIFGPEADQRLVNVITSQTGWLGLETEVLDAPLVVAMGRPRPAEAFDAYAISGYFGGILGTDDRLAMMQSWLAESHAAAEASAVDLAGQARLDHIAAHRFDLASDRAGRELMDGGVTGDPLDSVQDLITRVWPHHVTVARDNDLDLIMYEGGTHVVGLGAQIDNDALAEFFMHFNYSPQMGALYDRLLAGWAETGGRLFNAYADVYQPTKWGSWGHLRHLSDQNPRWDALVGGL